MSEDQPQLGPGLRLPIIAGWRALPGYNRLWYRDVSSNTEPLKIYDTIQRPDGYFFLLPSAFEKQLDESRQIIAILCRTNADTTRTDSAGKERPCAIITGVQRVEIKVFTDVSPLEGEWITEVKDIIPPDVAERITQVQRLLRWIDPRLVNATERKRLEAKEDPVDFSHDLADLLLASLPTEDIVLQMQNADVGARLESMRKWLEAQISQDTTASLGLRIDQLDLPSDVRAKLETEFSLLQSAPANSSDRERIMTYLQFAASLPWGDPIQPPTHSLAEARAILDKEHAGLDKAKKLILDQLATLLWWKQLRDRIQDGGQPAQPPLRNLLLVGPPGIGKTTFLNAIAEALARRLEIIACGGITDVVALNGLERGYIGARMGAIMEAVARAKTLNLVLGLDEIDKMGNTHRGDPYAVLLELTDQVRNSQFTDRYLQFPFDLSQVLIVATANTLDPIPAPLRDRFDIIQLRGYSSREKLHMARPYILPRLYKALSLSEEQVFITDDALTCIIEEYTYESGVRGLTRTLLTLLQRVLADLLTDPSHKCITPEEVHQYLGTPSVIHNQTPLKGNPGYGTVLTIVPGTGIGEIRGMQVSLVKGGSGECIFSGLGDDVAKESARIAVSYIKLHAQALKINSTIFAKHDIHIHFDEIAIRKSGPSAGVAILLAILSAIRGVALPEKWAMTGEISLDGRVLVVGGVAEKLVAAYKAGVTTLLIPAGNQANLSDIPEDVLADLTILPVATIDEAIAYAFPAETTVKGAVPVGERYLEREEDPAFG